MSEPTQTAAFFRVEGTIVKQGVLPLSAYLAGNGAGFGERLFRMGQVALAAPVMGLLGQNDRAMANRLAFVATRHMTEDRIRMLGREYWDKYLAKQILDRGVEMLSGARKKGHRIVLLSESIAQAIGPLAEALPEVDDLICNHLEFKSGKSTGKLCDPVIGGHEGGRWLDDYATLHGIDLARSVAYAAHGPDLLFLAAVGQPCAVNPDFTLRRAARAADWPVVEYGR